MWSCSNKENALTNDVTFKYHTMSFSCHQSLFGAESSHFKQVFNAVINGVKTKSLPGVSVRVCPDTNHVTFEYDEPIESLEAIHKYLHNPE